MVKVEIGAVTKVQDHKGNVHVGKIPDLIYQVKMKTYRKKLNILNEKIPIFTAQLKKKKK